MNIAYIDICRLLEIEQKRKHIIEYDCCLCDSDKFHIWRTHDKAKCYCCDNEIRLEDLKEELQSDFEEEKQTFKNLMEENKGVCY